MSWSTAYRSCRSHGSTETKRELIDELLESKHVTPGRTLDLGCGTGVESIFLATKGFETTGVDFSVTAIKRARRDAEAANVSVAFLMDDLSALRAVDGVFDLLVDFGAMSDLGQGSRDAYSQPAEAIDVSRVGRPLR